MSKKQYRKATGLEYLGTRSDPDILGGRPIPIYVPAQRYTVEEVNERARVCNRRWFAQKFGREPESDAELNEAIAKVIAAAEARGAGRLSIE